MSKKTSGVPLMPKIQTKIWPVVLPGELWARLRKPVTGTGGWQGLLTDLQNHTDPEKPTLELPDALMRRMIPYAVKFGSGGYQTLIRWVLCCVLEQHMVAILGSPVTLKSIMAMNQEAGTVTVTEGDQVSHA